MPPIEKFYLAAPFFNSAQVEMCQQIEVAFADAGVALFSPRQHKANSLDHKLTPQDAKDIFKCNVDNIDDCTVVLAVVDWLLPENQTIRLLEQKIPGQFAYPQLKSDHLNIPDAGTVWEMGYSYRMGKDIIMFTTRSATIPVNIMLSQCCCGIIRGIDHLRAFIKSTDKLGLKPAKDMLDPVSKSIKNV